MIKMYDLAGAEDSCRFSPYCWRVRMALAHKGLTFETIPWRFTEKDKIAFSGQGQVPVIVDGDRTVCDSWEIANYLDATYTNSPSLFGSPEAKGEALFIKHWSEQVLAPALFPLIALDIFNKLHQADKGYFRQKWETRIGIPLEKLATHPDRKLSKLRSLLAPLMDTLRIQPFVAGEQPNFADYIIFGWFQFAGCTSPLKLVEKDDPVCVWHERMLALFDGLAAQAISLV